MAIHFIFLVAGTNDKPADEFSDQARARAKEWVDSLVKNRAGASALAVAGDLVRFLLFQCPDNSVRVAELALKAKGTSTKLSWVDVASFTASGDPAADPSKFVVKPSGSDLLGMPHVYRSIRAAPDKSVLELAVMSHAWVDGPVTQSGSVSDDSPPPNDTATGFPLRNSGDTNGRVRTDFFPNMGEDPATIGKNALDEFKAKFDPKGQVVIFGCDGQDGPRVPTEVPVDPNDSTKGTFTAARPHLKSTAGEVIHQAYVKPLKEHARGGAAAYAELLRKGSVPDSTDVTIDMLWEFKDEVRDVKAGGHYNVIDLGDLQSLHYGMDTGFFPDPTTGPTKFTTKWNKVLGFVARQMQVIYGFKAAEVLAPLGVKVLSGPPGTKATEDGTGQSAVCGKHTKGTECTDIIQFYRTFIRLPTGDVDPRRYFVFDNDAVNHINDLAKVV
ncbi:MAG TPA: hypothetical protein VF765_18230 [Polyangiaceae bacterium]